MPNLSPTLFLLSLFFALLPLSLAIFVARRKRLATVRTPLDIDRYLASEGMARFLVECTAFGFPPELSREVIRALVSTSAYPSGLPAPSLGQSLLEHWGLDDDRHEVVNLLVPPGTPELAWNTPSLLDLRTLHDLMTFVQRLQTGSSETPPLSQRICR